LTLSTTMAPLAQYPRWICWTFEHDPNRPQKPRKRAINPRTGHYCKPQDPAVWCTYAEALAAAQQRGHGVGFVFQEGDGLFFLDMDNCLQEDGQWSPLARHLMEVWQGHAAIEVSQSGRGLHVFGYASQIPPHGCRNIPLGLELYHHERFVAFTDAQSCGAIDADVSAILAGVIDAYFPKTSQTRDVVDWTDEGDGARADDEELLQIMLQSGQRTAGAFFNDRHVTFADLWNANADALAKRWPSSNGVDSFDRSEADSALASHLAYWCGGNCERMERFMRRSALVRDKWDSHGSYMERTVLGACATVKNRATPHGGAKRISEDERRKRQRELTRRIGEGSDTVPTTEQFSLEEMLERFVYIKEGAQVADRLRPQFVLPFAEFKGATAASKHMVVKPDGVAKLISCAEAWKASALRKDAETLTFRAGANAMTTSPHHGKAALNLWSAPIRDEPPQDWQERSNLFADHIRWLWGEHADVFLDWLAHIEQRPGVLPHFGWVHISRVHGKGRNWISAVLARLWRGHVAASFDLLGAMDGAFNDRLSRCLLAIVDEINEGGSGSWRHAQTLRQMVTAEHREINPKYGRRHVEYNATRWLLFSNHTAAIPLGSEDRRFWVVDHEGSVHPLEYYKKLYAALDEPLFMTSVAHMLSERDISGFEPGQRPPLTKAKAALVELSQSENEADLSSLAQLWPVEVISWTELRQALPESDTSYNALKYPLERAGMRKVKRKVRTLVRPESVYSLRNHDLWAVATAGEIKAELARVAPEAKIACLCGDSDLTTGG